MAQDTVVFDTLEAVQELTTADVPERQAEAHIRPQARPIEQNFATRRDIAEVTAHAAHRMHRQTTRETRL